MPWVLLRWLLPSVRRKEDAVGRSSDPSPQKWGDDADGGPTSVGFVPYGKLYPVPSGLSLLLETCLRRAGYPYFRYKIKSEWGDGKSERVVSFLSSTLGFINSVIV